MIKKKKIGLLIGILLMVMFPLTGGVFSREDVVHAQGEEPTIGETVNLDWVSGENWPVGEVVTLTIEDPDTALSPDYTDFEVVGDDAQANFDYFNGNQIDFDIKPGHLVTLTSGDVSRTHEVLDVEVTKVDFDANSVEGYGLPKSELFVDINACGENIPVMTNGGGYWIAYVDPACDLETVNYLFADQYDTPNTRTSYFWSVPKGSISGMVTEQDTGMPIEGMEVAACPYYYEDGMPCYSGWTEADGSYIIQSVPLGTYRLDSGWSGNWVVEYYKNTPFSDEAKPVKVKPVQGKNAKDKHFNITGIDFTLELGGSISGHVNDANGDVAGVHVDVCAWDDSFCKGNETDENGDYIVYGLPEGDYRVSIWGGNGYWVDQFFDHVRDWEDATPVTVIANQNIGDINFDLEAGGTISGHVSDANGDVAGVHVNVCAWDDSFCKGNETDENGDYIVYGLPEGDYRVSVWGGQGGWIDEYYYETPFHHEASPVTVSVGNDTGGIDFTMETGGSISGVVSDANGPISNMAVDIVDGWFGTCTDENGQYTITGLPLGTYDIIAGRDFCGLHPYAEQIISNVTVDTGTPDVYGYDFSLVMGGSISGTVTPVGGGLIGDNIDVSACFEDGSVCGWTSVQGDGTYVITGLPSGDYRVHAYQYPEGYWIDEVYEETRDWGAYTPVSVVAGVDTPNIHFTLEFGGAITGVVTDDSGNPLEGLWVTANYPDNYYFASWAMTDAGGKYRILSLSEGEYNVTVFEQDGWAEQHYSGNPVPVSPGLDTNGIDFSLQLGGSISGVVTDEFGGHIPERIDVAACRVEDTSVCWWTIVQEDNNYTITGIPSGEFVINSYEVPGGHWIGETYPSTVTLEVDEDVGGINFTLAPVP